MRMGYRKILTQTVSALFLCTLIMSGGCSTLRVTQPPETADEQFLLSRAASLAISKISVANLRDRLVYVSVHFVNARIPGHNYLEADLRSHLLKSGVRLTNARVKAQIVMELRVGALGINQENSLIGIPAIAFGNYSSGSSFSLPVVLPQISILQNTTQQGYASVAYVAYWRSSGEIVASSGPFVGRTYRHDWWFLGFGPETSGNIPPALHQ
ncbi:MAG: DUF6655 family protein [Phycisphaerae bacterium]